MPDIMVLFACLSQCLDGTTMRQLVRVSEAMLSMSGRVTMRGIARWAGTGRSYRTIQRFFTTSLSWSKIQWVLIRRVRVQACTTPEDDYVRLSSLDTARDHPFSPAYWELLTGPLEEVMTDILSPLRLSRACTEDRTTCAAKDHARLACIQRRMFVACLGCLRACDLLTESSPPTSSNVLPQ